MLACGFSGSLWESLIRADGVAFPADGCTLFPGGRVIENCAEGRRPGDVIAQGQRRRSAALGLVGKRNKPCKGGIEIEAGRRMPPLQG